MSERIASPVPPEKLSGNRLRFAAHDPHRTPWMYNVGWRLSRLIFSAYFRIQSSGADNVPADGPFILASNHASFADPPLVGSECLRPISYLARETLFRNPIFGRVLRRVGCVPVDRDGASGKGLKTILERLLGGDGIILFPEGTRTSDGQLQRGRAGVGLIVLKSPAPVVPVRVFGTYEAFGRHHRFPRPRRVAVRFGPPLLFHSAREEMANASRPRIKELYQEVTDQIMEAIAAIQRP